MHPNSGYPVIQLDEYRASIQLDEPVTIEPLSDWRVVIGSVLDELGISRERLISPNEQLLALNGVLATIDPFKLPESIVNDIERIARSRILELGVVNSRSIPPMIEQMGIANFVAKTFHLWTGDITRLNVDAIVNAANAMVLGCRIPNHQCIDNAIHSVAGPRLRNDCATVMSLQNRLEPTGGAKITRGYALPAKYVLHTVGPQLWHGKTPSTAERELLKSAYLSCLEVAAAVDTIQSIAFCAISTGEFAFPKPDAAAIALSTVLKWTASNPDRFQQIVFCVYTQEDACIYEQAMAALDI